jgi:hypothetical protein
MSDHWTYSETEPVQGDFGVRRVEIAAGQRWVVVDRDGAHYGSYFHSRESAVRRAMQEAERSKEE